MTRQTLPERRFGALMLLLGAALTIAGAILCVRGSADVVLGGPGRLAIGGCALMAGIEPRRHRPYALPALLGLTAASLVALAAGRWQQAIFDGTASVLVLVTIWQAKASVNGAWLRGGPPIG